VAHVHGLRVDPADGVLYAATHHGLFRLPERGEATRVAERFQDTMGFTIIGPRTFLGSGHPDFRKDPHLPPRLGLIRSDDGGESWSNVSLSGKADFHALHAAHGNVYGWDATSGRFMVSGDAGRTWETRSVTNLQDFAIHPTEPGSVLAITEQGLLRSHDGGRTWTSILGAPRLAVLAWEDVLIGVGPDGAVHRSSDAGRTWTPAGDVGGQPEAVALATRAGVQTLYVAVAGLGILASTNRGTTFTLRYTE
jgi:photosystem II stability/assembly factor-like uncharacterized protein